MGSLAAVLAAVVAMGRGGTAAYGTATASSTSMQSFGAIRTIYFIGDSWSAGAYADPEHTLAQDAAEDLGVKSIVAAQSGTGYLNAPPGTQTYLQRAAAIPTATSADVVVLQGGSNDDGADPAALLNAVAQTVTAAHRALPRATVVLLGPGPDPWPITSSQLAVDKLLRLDAAHQRIPYISPLEEGWFTSSNIAAIIDPTTAHPTVRGDEIIGQRLAEDLRRVLGKQSPQALRAMGS